MKYLVYYTVKEVRSVEVVAPNADEAMAKVINGEAHDSNKNFLYGTDSYVKAEFDKVLSGHLIEKKL